jgi:NADPH-dependent curcumin reductase CurA
MGRTGREVQPASYPRGEVRQSDFRLVEVEVPEPAPGEVLVRNTWTSVDPALRIRLREKAPEGYFPAFALEAPMDGILTIGEVAESRADGFAPGDTVWHPYGWRDYALVEAGREEMRGIATLTRLDTSIAPPQAYLGPVGANGLTAYAGLVYVGELREGDVVWVSAAAGSVGSLVGQIAKNLGHRVIGSAGSEEKVRYLLEDLGFDAAFNYKSGPVVDLLRETAPDGIDLYFDNVGGDHLEAALTMLRRWGRVTLCGSISEYDATEPQPGPRNLFLATAKDLTLRGFRGSSFPDRLVEVQRQLGEWLRAGRLKWQETVVDGLENAPEALGRVMRGDTLGKTLVRIA